MSQIFVKTPPKGEMKAPPDPCASITETVPVGETKRPSSAPIVAEGSIDGFGTWTLDKDGLLTIDGKGKMPNWKWNDGNSQIPWKAVRDKIKIVSLSNGITSIGDCALYQCTNLTQITIPHGVTRIGGDAFFACTSLTQISIPNSVIIIEYAAFCSCTGLTQVTIPKEPLNNYP